MIWFGLLLLQGAIPAGIVYMTKAVVDAVAAVVGAGASVDLAGTLAMPVLAMGGLLLARQLVGSAAQYVNTVQSELVTDFVKDLIHAKAGSVDYGFYESDRYYDLLEQANSQASGSALALLQNLGGLLRSGITFVSIAALLMTYSLWLPLVLGISTIPAFVILVRHNRYHHDWWERTTADRRRAKYYDIMLTQQAAAAEVRLYNLSEVFREAYQAVRRRLRAERLALLRRQMAAGLGASLVGLVVTAGTMAWIGWRAVLGLATLGDLALFYQAFNQGQSLMGALLNNMGQIYTNTLFIQHLTDFLDQEARLIAPARPVPFPTPIRQGIRFEGITFRYPGAERPALDAFDLELPAGQITAIVGENGVGKSTLIKLLCRFYDPEAGRITVDGIDLRDFDPWDLRRHLSVMFQFPVRYQMTARENITLGDTERPADLEAIRGAAREAGADEFIEQTARQYETLLGRWFAGGTELSGGQWQRIALARAFWRQAPVLILDEPTNFMDAWAETEWVRRFRRLAHGRISLMITHRFTSAMYADVIHVMDHSGIVESGTHDELVALGGRYAASWNEQMQARRPDKEASAVETVPPIRQDA